MSDPGANSDPNEPAAELHQSQAGLNPGIMSVKDGNARFTRGIAILALAVSVIGLILNVYFPNFYVKRDFTVTLSGFMLDERRKMMFADLIFSNGGNRYEAVMDTSFVLPLRKDSSSNFWPNQFPHMILAPFTIEPHGVAYRRLEQPMDKKTLLSMKRANSHNNLLGDPNHQLVAVRILVRDVSGLPRRHCMSVAEFETNGPETSSGRRFHNVTTNEPEYSPIIQVDLLKGGELGKSLDMLISPSQYASGVPGDESAPPLQEQPPRNERLLSP